MNLQCRTLIFAGESSPFHAESVYMSTKMDRKICALVEVGSPFTIGNNLRYSMPSANLVQKDTTKITRSCLLEQVQACGSLVTEEHPNSMIIPIECFLMGFGYHRQPHFASSSSNGSNPASPSSHSCIAPELLSPQSLGIKLKPIRTRVHVEI